MERKCAVISSMYLWFQAWLEPVSHREAHDVNIERGTRAVDQRPG